MTPQAIEGWYPDPEHPDQLRTLPIGVAQAVGARVAAAEHHHLLALRRNGLPLDR